MAHLSHPKTRAARSKPSRGRALAAFAPVAPGYSALPSSEKAVLPLGALMLAVSMAGWAQTPPGGATDAPAATSASDNTLAPVTVIAPRDRAAQTYQSGITSVGKVPVPAKDIPQSLTVVNEKLIHDQGKDSFKGALENVVGITFEAGEGGRVGDNIRLRGFSAAGDIYQDGMRDIAQYNRDLFNVDRVEVLRGAASMLFGRGSTGGVINQVSKQARMITEHEVNATVGTDGYQRYQGDFNFKLEGDAALRINAMATDGEGRGDNAGASTHRRGLALDYRFGIGTANEFEISYYHLNYNDKPDWGFAWLENRPAPAPTNRYWYGLDSDFQKDKADALTLSHTHRWSDGSSLKTTVRDGYYSRSMWATQSSFAAGTTAANINDATVVNRRTNAKAGEEHHTFLQSDYLTTTSWFGRKNSILLGAEYAVENSSRSTYPSLVTAKPPTTAGNPGSTGISGNLSERVATSFKASTLGLYVQDTIELTPQWKLVGGLRVDQFQGNFDRSGNTAPNNTALSRSDSLLSKRLGLMYQPTEEASYYAAWGTSFNTSGDLYQYDPRSANTPPESSRNMEIGAKWELYGGDLSLRTALARTDKYNERNTDIDTANNSYLLSGQRHTDALEFEIAGRITPQWDVFAGIGFLKAVIDKSGSNAAGQAEVGQNPGLSPSRQANLFTTYRLDSKWRVGGGFTAVSQNKPANSVTTGNRAPGYVKADALVEYRVNAGNTIKLNIDNLFDKVYYNTLYRGFAAPGDARAVRVTLTSKF
ncbi:MAG: TonB-dependent siderophore receptor [Polaromonas sp.]|uniref:TonB-dependent receptor n=1 Tax=Polaromonas sp. TaxID=1869339 RepID=UPI00248724FE|nr:TonB-dependent siderophore receptor [Polaromonas sp.]MDI1238418.1 TonB-dependent siderophore receptor [Polaromonas sp.]